MKVLVFDTETSGLPAERNSPITDTEKYPYILQLSYKVYDTALKKTLAIHDNYIKVADNVVITPGSIAIHGITRDILESRGIPIEEALARFDAHVALSDVVVAHNLQFDKTLLQVEYERLNFELWLIEPELGLIYKAPTVYEDQTAHLNNCH